ncbi:MAG: M23 family metallopeptidase [Bacillota bacterium]|nr:M23 family metallopeptidase [Bacillota bacterium]MDW7685229.1 M23 family metallopeptidase [Bacillota bacterium]
MRRKKSANLAAYLCEQLQSSAAALHKPGANLNKDESSIQKPAPPRIHGLLKPIGALVILVSILATALGVHAYVGSHTYVVYVDGQEVGFVSDGEEILGFVEELTAAEAQRYNLDVKIVQDVQVQREQRKDIKVDDWEVKDLLRRQLIFDVYAYVITINDKPTLAVRTIEDYERVIDDLKSAYVDGNENAVVQAVMLNEKVEARLTLVDPDALYSADKASEILRRGTDKRESYLVSRGDSLWTIARNNNMSVDDIQSANPQLGDSDRLQPGDELNLVVSEPLVNVSVTQDVTLTQRIPFETTYQNDSSMYKGTNKVIKPGQYGYTEVTYRITQTNGSEVLREIVNEKVIEEPQTQIVARGTKARPQAPSYGTGRFLWPVSGGGRISSRYGPRGGGFHRGLDIAAPTGTPLVASDSGTVIHAGWQGAYGILVTIDHGNGYVTKYAHNSAVLVSRGQRVQKGQQIARIGSTGNSTGPHVHFEVLINGQHRNPLSYL